MQSLSLSFLLWYQSQTACTIMQTPHHSSTTSPLSTTVNSSSSTTNSSTTTPNPANTSHFLSVKLTPDNYLIWRAQIQPYLYGQRLFGYIDGTIPEPPRRGPDGSPNPTYIKWFEQDQLVVSILISSLSERLITQVIRHTKSRAIWHALETSFSQQSQAKLLYLQQQLSKLERGNETIMEYYNRASHIYDQLAAIGHPISETQFNSSFLNGAGKEFDIVVTALYAQRSTISPEEILRQLLIYEARHKLMDESSPLPQITANTAETSSLNHPSQNFSQTSGRRGGGRYFSYGRGYRGGTAAGTSEPCRCSLGPR